MEKMKTKSMSSGSKAEKKPPKGAMGRRKRLLAQPASQPEEEKKDNKMNPQLQKKSESAPA